LTINTLSRRFLAPATEAFQALFAQPDLASENESLFSELQARLHYALEQFLHPQGVSPLLLVKAPEEKDYLQLLTQTTLSLRDNDESALTGVDYQVNGSKITVTPARSTDDNFASTGPVVYADWIEAEQLFGCVRQFNGEITLQPGLVHQANGGILILSLRTLMAQPLLWMRLKNVISHQRFDWLTFDDARPLPVSIPSMPLTLKLVLVGDRDSLADFEEMEPELAETSLYSEFEDNLQISDEETLKQWCQWVWNVAREKSLPGLAADAWPLLMQEGARDTGDQEIMPLCPLWIARQLREAAPFTDNDVINAEQLKTMLEQRLWREGFLAERMQDEILLEQILIETEGECIGQINALSVIDFPGHERKAELGGNIHAKGMMLMQAFLMAELDLEQQLPFSASLTFEQSYSEVDGDSASMAELCALISALANVPINQSIAITGSVDQFGRAQPVGGLNEKIEGFFAICAQRGLSGKQGVIIPSANVRHLSLSSEIQEAVEAGAFSIWAIDDVGDALPLLTQLNWDGEGQTLLQTIQERIAQATQPEPRYRYPWPLRWLNRSHSN